LRGGILGAVMRPVGENRETSSTAAAAPGKGERAPLFLTAEWRDLALLNFAVEPAVLAPRVPAGTELDCWGGSALVSLVGFRFVRTRVLGVPIPFHTRFEEVNLRFYVRRRASGDPGGSRRGVVFVREIVPRRAIAWAARTLYHENYVALPMRHRVSLPAAAADAAAVFSGATSDAVALGAGLAEYSWRWQGRWSRLAARVRGAPSLPAAGSEAELITEHYWGYASQPDGSCLEYQVEHPQWEVWPATASELDLDAGAAQALYGEDLAPFLAVPPVSAFVAAGSRITVRRGERFLRLSA
jgi:hypothetical protein